MEMVETWWNTRHSSCLTMRNHILVTFFHLISDVGFIFHVTLRKRGFHRPKKSQFYGLKSMEMVETWWNTCHSSCLTMGNHIPVTLLDVWYELHIPCRTSILGQKGGFTGQKEPILRPKQCGNGRNMMKYMSLIMVDHRESHTSHISI